MNLSPYLPPTSNDANMVLSLLAVLANPEDAKKMLARMVEERKAIENATSKQQELLTQTEGEAKQAKADLDKANSARAAIERRKFDVDEAEHRVNAKQAEVTRREAMVAERERELAAKANNVAIHEGQVDALASKLEQRETALKQRESKLAEDIAENEKWLASLKPPRGR